MARTLLLHSGTCVIYCVVSICIIIWGIATKTYSTNYEYELKNYNMTFLPYTIPYYYNGSVKVTVNTSDLGDITLFRVSTYGVSLALTSLLGLRSSILVLESFRLLYVWEKTEFSNHFGLVLQPNPEIGRTFRSIFEHKYVKPASYYAMIMQWLILFLVSNVLVILISLSANLKYLTTVFLACIGNTIVWLAIIFWPIFRKYNVKYGPAEQQLINSNLGITTGEIGTSETEKAKDYIAQVQRENKRSRRNYMFLTAIQVFIVTALFLLNCLQCLIQIPLLETGSQVSVSFAAFTILFEYALLKFIMYQEDKVRHQDFLKTVNKSQYVPPESPYPAWSRFVTGTNNIATPVWIIHEIILAASVTLTVSFLLVF